MNADLRDRLAGLHIEMTPTTAQRHLGTITQALAEPAPSVAPRRRPRRLLAAGLAAATLLLIPAAAIAAEGTVPGDLLYPVKRTTEWAWSLVDPGIRIQHRVAELEVVIDRRAPVTEVTERLADADAAVRQGRPSPTIVERLRLARERIDLEYGVDRPRDRPRPEEEQAPTTSTTQAPQRDETDDTREAESTDTTIANAETTTTQPADADAGRDDDPPDRDHTRGDG